jgi:hypothetical protein
MIFPAFAGMHGPPLRRVLLFLGYLSVQMVEIHGARIASHQLMRQKNIRAKPLFYLLFF